MKVGENMHVLGEHVLIDLYSCIDEKIESPAALQDAIVNALAITNQCVEELDCQILEDEIFLVAVSHHCHVILHAYPQLGYVAADVYTFEKSVEPKVIMKELQRSVGSEKVKATSIRRGDFGNERDMKPRKQSSLTAMGRVTRTRTRLTKTGKNITSKGVKAIKKVIGNTK